MCVGDGCSSCRASRGYACLVVMVVVHCSVDGYSVNHIYKGLINKGILEKKEKKTLCVWACFVIAGLHLSLLTWQNYCSRNLKRILVSKKTNNDSRHTYGGSSRPLLCITCGG